MARRQGRPAKPASKTGAKRTPAKPASKKRAPLRSKRAPAPRKKNPRRRRRNGEPTAEEMYTKFHGKAPRRTVEMQIEEDYPAELADLGKLTALSVYVDTDDDPTLVEPTGNVRVTCTPDGGQIYFIGGDQTIDLRALGLHEQLPKDHVMIGEADQIVYTTRKGFHDFDLVDYVHEFGEESDIKPQLAYDVRNRRVYLVGGAYQVKPEGIVD